jgi:hypothetical protein
MDNFISILQIIGFIITALSAAVRLVKWVRGMARTRTTEQ